ncbi:MAG: Holliday junction branch migration protein RuvA [Thermovirgaceae bacterium]|nr:Holliday junction branch migration protein RuvA [Thermovirgaceae bacterium]
MLYSLEGKVSSIDSEGIGIEVGGIGFFLMCSKSVFREASSEENIRVLTCLQVSDAGPALFGFMDKEERLLFHLLLKVRGVGSKVAIAIMRTLDFREIINSITSARSSVLCQVPGVGKKTAERLCFELKQNIEKTGFGIISDMASTDSDDQVMFVYQALETLGFTRVESRPAVSRVIDRLGKIPGSPEDLLREALSELRRN